MKLKFHQIGACLCIVALLGAGCSKESRKAGHLKHAETHFKAGEYDSAEVECLNVLRLDKTNAVALRTLGVMAYEQGRLSHAYSALSAAAKAAPDDFEVRLRLAMVYLAGGKTKEARAESLLLLERQPTNEYALLLLADSSLATNDVQDAQQRLAQMRQTNGATVGYHLAQGMLHIRNNSLPKAEESFLDAVSLDPKSCAGHMALGNLCLIRNDLTNAQSRFKTAADLSPPRSSYRLRYANFKLMTGDAAAAKHVLEDIMKQAPDYLPALLGLAQITLAEQSTQDCERMLNSLLQRDPTHLEAMLLKARLRIAQNQPEQALSELDRAIKLNPRLPQAHYQAALVYLRQNDLPNASKSLNQVLALQPDSPEATLQLAEINIRRGDSAAAVNTLTQFVSRRPALVQAQLLLATAYRASGNLDPALRIYENLSLSYPTNPQPPFLMGLVLQQQGRRDAARTSFEKSLAMSPDSPAALEQLVNLDLEEKNFITARNRVQKEMSRIPTNVTSCLLLAKIHLAETNLTAAEDVLHRAVALSPDSTAPQSLLAQVFVASGKKEAALKKFNEVVARNTNDVASWMQIAHLHTAASNYSAARQAYERVLAVNPRYIPALNNLAYISSEFLNDRPRAYELGTKARNLMPNDPYTADTFGWVLYRNGDYPRALGLIQESARRFPSEPEVLFHLGMTHYMLGEEDAARIALQNAASLGPIDAGWKQEAQQRLRVLAVNPATAGPDLVRELEGLLPVFQDDPILLSRLAAVAGKMGDLDKAIAGYEKALAVNTNLTPAIVKLAQLLASPSKDPDRAFALARRARNLDPDNPQIAHALGQIAFRAARSGADFQWAHSLLQESARNYPDDPEVLHDLAVASYAVGQVSNAVTVMGKIAAAKQPSRFKEEASTFLEMHSLLLEPDAALSQSEKVASMLQRQPDYVPTLMVSGMLREKQGNIVAARDAYEKVVRLYPLFTPAFKPLALLYDGALNDPEKAYDYASRAREAFPGDMQVARLLGGLSFKRGAHAAAVQLLKASAPSYPSDASLFYMLGLAQHKAKLGGECRSALTKALELDPNSPFTPEAKSVLSSLK